MNIQYIVSSTNQRVIELPLSEFVRSFMDKYNLTTTEYKYVEHNQIYVVVHNLGWTYIEQHIWFLFLNVSPSTLKRIVAYMKARY